MSDDKPRPRIALYVDRDNPRYVDLSNGNFGILPDDDAPSASSTASLSEGWTEVGFTTDPLDSTSQSDEPLFERTWADMANGHISVSSRFTGVDADRMLAALVGAGLADDRAPVPSFAVQGRARVLRPPLAPRKGRRLTGKRYRIARRRYAREMRAWRRGQGTPVEIHYHLPRVRAVDVGDVPFGGHRFHFVAFDEGAPDHPTTER